MRLVVLESPFAGDTQQNKAYARACVRHSLLQGEAPFASHLLYTQPGILVDAFADERAKGIQAGIAWYKAASACVVYKDLGISPGMKIGIERARDYGIFIEYRMIGWSPQRYAKTPMEPF